MQISAIFAETADQEKEHAERFFKFLEGGFVNVNAAFPAGIIGDTAANLAAAADGEYDEWHTLYPGFAEVARQEGFAEIALVLTTFVLLKSCTKSATVIYCACWKPIRCSNVRLR